MFGFNLNKIAACHYRSNSLYDDLKRLLRKVKGILENRSVVVTYGHIIQVLTLKNEKASLLFLRFLHRHKLWPGLQSKPYVRRKWNVRHQPNRRISWKQNYKYSILPASEPFLLALRRHRHCITLPIAAYLVLLGEDENNLGNAEYRLLIRNAKYGRRGEIERITRLPTVIIDLCLVYVPWFEEFVNNL